MEFKVAGACIDEKVLKQISSNQANFMIKRIEATEKKFGDLCTSLAAYARGHGRLRDKGDEICRVLLSHARKEQVACTTALCLREVSHYFSVVQDYAESTTRRIEDNVVRPLSSYGQECSSAKERIRKAHTSRKKELEHQMALETSRRNMPSLGRNVLCQSNQVIEEIEAFEEKQLHDLKKILNDFISIEIAFHAKAVENLSEAIKYVSSLNVEADLELFRVFLHPLSTTRGHLQPSTPAIKPPGRDEEQQINLQQGNGEKKDGDDEDEEDDDDEDEEDEGNE